MISSSLEAGREHLTEEVIVNIDRHLVLKLAEYRRGSEVLGITNFLVISSDSGESEDLSPLRSIPFRN